MSPPPRSLPASRVALLALLGLSLAVLGAALALWMRGRPDTPPQPPAAAEDEEEPAPRLVLAPGRFADLPGWERDDPAEAIEAFLRSCAAFRELPADQPLGGRDGYAGTAGDWRGACDAAPEVGEGAAAARAFFEERFVPVAAANREDRTGLFTGYYEPTLHGSRRRHGPYRIPLYARPPELVEVDLGAFREDLEGRRIAGRLKDGRLVPFADREAIVGGALAGRGLEVLWVDDPVDAFFLEIQGSGRVRLEDGGEVRIGYASQNGHPYYAIGRELVEMEALSREEVSLQTIRAWLAENPERAAEVMATNASYVFFRTLGSDGPYGAQGVVLTPGRSLAVDRAVHALGVPVWLAASRPAVDPEATDVPLRRLMVAQDTGGAIRGPVRGDVFWGPGDEAEQIAGRMRHEGRMWLLLPRELAAALTAGEAPESEPGAGDG